MNKRFKFIIFYIIAILISSSIGCSVKGKDPVKEIVLAPENGKQLTTTKEIVLTPKSREEITTKAIYLAPENGGQLTKEEIEKYPEVIKVSSLNELKNLVSKNTSIWIDKDAVDLLDSNWLQKIVQNPVPIVLIGYNNALYSFRDKLSGFGIFGPYVNWSKETLEPGFSIWMMKGKTDTSRSAFMKGYNTTPDTKQILSITNMLLEGKFPE